MKIKRILSVVMLAILLTVGLVPAASAVTWKEPWDFAGGYYTEDWAKHFATKKLTTSSKATMYRVRSHTYTTDSKKFEKVVSLRVRWEPRAYVLNTSGKQIKRWFTRENRLTYTSAHYSYLYYKAGDSLAIVGQTNVNKRWYAVNIEKTPINPYNKTSKKRISDKQLYDIIDNYEGHFGWVFGRYVVRANKSGDFYVKVKSKTATLYANHSVSSKAVYTVKKGEKLTPTYTSWPSGSVQEGISPDEKYELGGSLTTSKKGHVWHQVYYNGKKYWIRNDFVTVVEK